MIDIQSLVQSTLDNALAGSVYVFWQRKVEIEDDSDHEEYIVYTRGNDEDLEKADNGQVITKEADVTIRYYYKYELIGTAEGRARVKSRESQILSALKSAGFLCLYGFFDAGDVDSVGCFTSVAECSYWRAI